MEETTKVEDRFALTSGFWSTLTEISAQEPDKKEAALAFVGMLQSDRFMRIMDNIAAIASLHEEICSTLDEIQGRQSFILRIATLEQLTVSIKYFVIAWSTMLDLLAQYINTIFDLGLEGRDASLWIVLRNKHVVQSSVGATIAEYTKSSSFIRMKRQRNAIVHSGKILDQEVEDLQAKMNRLLGNQYSILSERKLPQEEFDKEYNEL